MSVQVIVPPLAAAIAEGEFIAGVKVYGFEFRASHIGGKFAVQNVSGLKYSSARPKWQARSSAEIALKWLKEQVAALGPEYMAAHRALYELGA